MTLRIGKGPPPPPPKRPGRPAPPAAVAASVEPPYRYTDQDALLVRLAMAAGFEAKAVAPLLNNQKGISQRMLEDLYGHELANGAAAIQLRLTHRLMQIAASDGRGAVQAAIFLLTSRYGWATGKPAKPGEEGGGGDEAKVFTLRIGAAGDGKQANGAT